MTMSVVTEINSVRAADRFDRAAALVDVIEAAPADLMHQMGGVGLAGAFAHHGVERALDAMQIVNRGQRVGRRTSPSRGRGAVAPSQAPPRVMQTIFNDCGNPSSGSEPPKWSPLCRYRSIRIGSVHRPMSKRLSRRQPAVFADVT